MKTLYRKYKHWAETWTHSQLLFLTIVVIALGSAGLYATHRFVQAQEVIKTLTTKQP